MKIDKIKILILVFLALAGYFIWGIFQKPPEPKTEQAPAPSTKKTNEGPPFSQEKRIYMPSDETAPLFFKNINETAKTAETKLQDGIDAVTQTAPAAPSGAKISESTPTEIILSLTDDEFHFLYPDAFIASLIDAQNLFIKDYDPTYKPLLKIETDAHVRYVEEKIVAALLSTNMLTKEKAERFITTIRFTLPQLQLTELKNRNPSASNQSSTGQYSISSPRSFSNELFLAGLLKRLNSALIPKSQAACGGCVSLSLCFQVGGVPTPGLVIFRVACYCTGCLYGQGCLDFCQGRAALYDPTTGICGCG